MKHRYLIEKLNEIPSEQDIKHKGWSSSALYGKYSDFRYNTEDILLVTIEFLTKGTQMEDIGKELSEKARYVFDFYSN